MKWQLGSLLGLAVGAAKLTGEEVVGRFGSLVLLLVTLAIMGAGWALLLWETVKPTATITPPSPGATISYPMAPMGAFVAILSLAIACIPWLGPGLVFGVWAMMRPTRFDLSERGLTIVWPTGTRWIPIERVHGAEVLTREALVAKYGRPMRVGVGGMFGGFGLGIARGVSFDMYVSRSEDLVVVHTVSGRPLLITPAGAAQFVWSINHCVQQRNAAAVNPVGPYLAHPSPAENRPRCPIPEGTQAVAPSISIEAIIWGLAGFFSVPFCWPLGLLALACLVWSLQAGDPSEAARWLGYCKVLTVVAWAGIILSFGVYILYNAAVEFLPS